jgi:LPXTG-motif cell wall-anchored protein
MRAWARRACIAFAVGSVTLGGFAGVARAEEILPNVDVQGATVTGPGLRQPAELDESAATDFVKGFLATGIFNPKIATLPSGASVYTVKYTVVTSAGGAPTVGTAKFAWDGQQGWVSGGDLLTKQQFIVAPPATTRAVQKVLDANGVVPEPADDSSSTVVWLVVAGVVVLIGVVGIVVYRRRRGVTHAGS